MQWKYKQKDLLLNGGLRKEWTSNILIEQMTVIDIVDSYYYKIKLS